MNNNVARWLIFPVVLGLSVTGCEKLDLGKFGKTEPNAVSPAPAAAASPSIIAVPAAGGGKAATPVPTIQLPDFASLVEKEGSAVVNVSVSQSAGRGAAQFRDGDEEDPLSEFFRRFAPQQQPHRGDAPVRQGVGSGFIISNDGYILTNRHVVAEADIVTVRLNDKREFRAKVIGHDSRTDVALLKIDAKELPTVPIGNTGRIRVGEWVVASGSPFGFENTVTAGIVSAVNRVLPDENFVPFIQTDAAVNPGNSGGPLFNMRGEVIGINSQIYSRTGGFMGLSFAIPIDVAIDVAEQLKATGRVTRGRIGVQVQPLTAELANSFGLPNAQGALVAAVERGSPAEKAGLQAGDVILEFDGKKVSASSDLPRLVSFIKPGTNVKLKVWRKGEARDLSTTIGEMPGERIAARPGEPQAKTASMLGLSLAETPDGLVVQDVQSLAARAGLRPGDLVVSLNNQQIETVEQFRERVAAAPRGRNLALLVQRGDNTLFIAVPPQG